MHHRAEAMRLWPRWGAQGSNPQPLRVRLGVKSGAVDALSFALITGVTSRWVSSERRGDASERGRRVRRRCDASERRCDASERRCDASERGCDVRAQVRLDGLRWVSVE